MNDEQFEQLLKKAVHEYLNDDQIQSPDREKIWSNIVFLSTNPQTSNALSKLFNFITVIKDEYNENCDTTNGSGR